MPFSLGEGALHLEAGLGGRILEVVEDGTAHVWGHVTLWDPPARLALKWYVGRKVETATDVEIRFAPTDDGRCGITLVQSGWDALGAEAGPMCDRNLDGWHRILTRGFAPYVESTEGTENG